MRSIERTVGTCGSLWAASMSPRPLPPQKYLQRGAASVSHGHAPRLVRRAKNCSTGALSSPRAHHAAMWTRHFVQVGEWQGRGVEGKTLMW